MEVGDPDVLRELLSRRSDDRAQPTKALHQHKPSYVLVKSEGEAPAQRETHVAVHASAPGGPVFLAPATDRRRIMKRSRANSVVLRLLGVIQGES